MKFRVLAAGGFAAGFIAVWTVVALGQKVPDESSKVDLGKAKKYLEPTPAPPLLKLSTLIPFPEYTPRAPREGRDGRIAFATNAAMQFGIWIERDAAGNKERKLLTFSPDGGTNTTVVRVDGKDLYLGADGKVLSRDGPAAAHGAWRSEKASQSVWRSGDIVLTQTLEVIAGHAGSSAAFDTVLVKFALSNAGSSPRLAGLRIMIDTLIGGNDGVPFAVPGRGLISTQADFRSSAEIPDFVQALERPDLKSPGTVAHLTTRVGAGLEAPGRLSLTHWKSGVRTWEVPMENLGSDSAVVLYWPERSLPPGASRAMGFAYGIGNLTVGSGSGDVAVTTGGRIAARRTFTLTSYLNQPKPGETVQLDVPEGLTVVGGNAPIPIPPPDPSSGGKTSIVSWKLKADRPGAFSLKVRSSAGREQIHSLQVAENLPGDVEPEEPRVRSLLNPSDWHSAHMGEGRTVWRDKTLSLLVPRGQHGVASAWHPKPIRGDFEAQMQFHITPWNAQAKSLMFLRFVAASHPRDSANSFVLVDRSVAGNQERFGSNTFSQGRWGTEGVAVATKEFSGKLLIRRQGNVWETASWNDVGSRWSTVGRFRLEMPEEIFLGLSAGNEIGRVADSPVQAIVSRVSVVEKN